MSEEKIKGIEEDLKELRGYAETDRLLIKELEQKLLSDDKIATWNGYFEKAFERIEALEKTVKDCASLSVFMATINELKEQLEGKADTEIVYEDFAIKHFQIKEVLRELNQVVKGINYDLSIRKLFDNNIYNHYSERLAENEKKLDGGNTDISKVPSEMMGESLKSADSKPSKINYEQKYNTLKRKIFQAQRGDHQTGKPLIEGQFGLYEHVWVAREDLEWLITTLGNYLHRKNIEPTNDDRMKRFKLLENYLSEEKDD